jgi:hypothetical protein
MRDPNAKTVTNTALVREMRARRAARGEATPPKGSSPRLPEGLRPVPPPSAGAERPSQSPNP